MDFVVEFLKSTFSSLIYSYICREDKILVRVFGNYSELVGRFLLICFSLKLQFRHSNYITVPFVDISVQHKEERPWGAKICGKVDAKKPDISSFNIADATKEKMLPSAFVDREGKIDVRIYVANVTRSADTELDLKIAFTAYQRELAIGNFLTSNLMFQSLVYFSICLQFAACSDVSSPLYKKCSTPICIWHEYFNDGILNCPYTTCADEGGCQLYVEGLFARSALNK